MASGKLTIAWGGFENGRIPTHLLRPVKGVQGTEHLENTTLEQFELMKRDHDRATLRNLQVNAGYRPLGKPTDSTKMRTQWGFRKKYLSGQGNLAARPGTSNHGYAKSIDLYDYDLRWLKKNAGKYGFYNDVPSEGWHWTRMLVATVTPKIVVEQILEAEVAHIVNDTTGEHVIIDAFGAEKIADLVDEVGAPELRLVATAIWGKAISLTPTLFRIAVIMANNRGKQNVARLRAGA